MAINGIGESRYGNTNINSLSEVEEAANGVYVRIKVPGSAAYKKISKTNYLTDFVDAKISTFSGTLAAVATSGSYNDLVDVPANNYGATTNPTANDDTSEGYSVDSKWYNTLTGDTYLCVDASEGAAVWVDIALTVDDLATVAFTGDSDDLTEGGTNLFFTNARVESAIAAASSLDLAGTLVVTSVNLDLLDFTLLEPDGSGIVFRGGGAGQDYIVVNIQGRSIEFFDGSGNDRIGYIHAGNDIVNVPNLGLVEATLSTNAFLYGGNNTLLEFEDVSIAVNYIKITNAVTTGAPKFTAAGSDTNISINLVPKGSGVVQANGVEVVSVSGSQTLTNKTLTSPRIGTAILDTNGNELINFTVTASAVNQIEVVNGATGSLPKIIIKGNLSDATSGTGLEIGDDTSPHFATISYRKESSEDNGYLSIAGKSGGNDLRYYGSGTLYNVVNSGVAALVLGRSNNNSNAGIIRFENQTGIQGYVGIKTTNILALGGSFDLAAGGANAVEFNTSTGAVYFPLVGTTASAANAFLNSGSSPANQLLRSTSSIRYKTNVEDIWQQNYSQVLKLRPVYYRSKAEADNPRNSYYGFIAEEVAKVDPRLVHWMGNKPDGVQYERIPVLMLPILASHDQAIREIYKRLEMGDIPVPQPPKRSLFDRFFS